MVSNSKNLNAICIPHGEGRTKLLRKIMKNIQINTDVPTVSMAMFVPTVSMAMFTV